ncbi:hypothetical protein GQ44DRAFT_776448 [Phaeosphaeriaceae sp. PMI808]|nr:hypothetical protein GQ44DRAFT_776448 [Phaeosphaeriaceae sp. PMI808]
MSRYRNNTDEHRVDSVTDLSQGAYDDFETSQTVAASSVVDPWSQYNTRHYPSSFNPSERTSGPYTHSSNPTTQAYPKQNSVEIYLPEGPSARYTSPDATIVTTCSRTPTLPSPSVPASSSIYNDDAHAKLDISYNVGQWLSAENGSIGYHDAKSQEELGIEQLPCSANDVLTFLKKNLSPADYSRRCDSGFTRWENIVQQLKDNQSDAYPVYAKVLEDIRAIVYTIDVTAHNTCTTGSSTRCGPSPPNHRAGIRGTGSSGLGSQTSRVSKRNEHKSPLANRTSGKALTSLGEHSKKRESRAVDCPVYKHHLMHNTAPPCRGCRTTVMSQIRHHLKPTRASTHEGFPEFVEQCSRCKQDFVKNSTYEQHKAAVETGNTCTFQTQARGDIVIPWARQYLALYPDSIRIPLPWYDETGWLPDDIIEQCSLASPGLAISDHFLEQRQSQGSPQAPNGSDYLASMRHVLQDFANPVFIHNPRSSSPVQNQNRFAGIHGDSAQHWQSLLQSLEAHQRTIRETAPYLDVDQVQILVNECETIYYISHGYQQNVSQPMQAEVNSHTLSSTEANIIPCTTPTHVQRLPSTASNSIFTTPNQVQRQPTSDHEQATTPSTSTQPSSRSNGTWSSENHNSAFTDPSSTHGSNNPLLLSPFTPPSHRHWCPSGRPEDSLRIRRGPSRRSLPENSGDYVDQSLINLQSEFQDTNYSDDRYSS